MFAWKRLQILRRHHCFYVNAKTRNFKSLNEATTEEFIWLVMRSYALLSLRVNLGKVEVDHQNT